MAGKRKKDSMIPLIWIGTHDMRSFTLPVHSRWIRLAINLGTSGPGIKGFRGGDLVLNIFLMASVTLTNETADALEEQDDDGHLCENRGVF